MAIMGPSGAGKSSMLNCLSLRNRSFEGCVLLNGKPADDQYSLISGFVHQDDLFIPLLTVKEHLLFQARLRMDK